MYAVTLVCAVVLMRECVLCECVLCVCVRGEMVCLVERYVLFLLFLQPRSFTEPLALPLRSIPRLGRCNHTVIITIIVVDYIRITSKSVVFMVLNCTFTIQLCLE